METVVSRRGDLAWFQALEKRWENRPKRPVAKKNPHRERLVAFYRKHNPSKLESVDAVLQKYNGKEEELFEKLEQRYKEDDKYPAPPTKLDLDEHNCPVCFLEFSVNKESAVIIQLFSHITPLAAENFRQLCLTKYRNSKIHRIVPNMCVQGGDYTVGDGTGGRSIYPSSQEGIDVWGNFKDETFLAHNASGLVSMANNGKDRNGSQFFITLAPTKHLNGKHVVFGRVIKGLDVVLAMGKKPTNKETQRPLEDFTIVDCGEILDDGETWKRASEQVNDVGVSISVKPSPFASFAKTASPFGVQANDSIFGSSSSSSSVPTSLFGNKPTEALSFSGRSLFGSIAQDSDSSKSPQRPVFAPSATTFGREAAPPDAVGSALGSMTLFGEKVDAISSQQTGVVTFNFGSSSKDSTSTEETRDLRSLTFSGDSKTTQSTGSIFGGTALNKSKTNDTSSLRVGAVKDEATMDYKAMVAPSSSFAVNGKTGEGMSFSLLAKTSTLGGQRQGEGAIGDDLKSTQAPVLSFGGKAGQGLSFGSQSLGSKNDANFTFEDLRKEEVTMKGDTATSAPSSVFALDDEKVLNGSEDQSQKGTSKGLEKVGATHSPSTFSFGGKAGEGLSFGTLSQASQNGAAYTFGNLAKGKPSPFDNTSAAPSVFSALKAAETSVFGRSSPLAFRSPSVFGVSSAPTPNVLFSASEGALNDGKLSFRRRTSDSETSESEDSDGSEYVEKSVRESSDEDFIDECHYASGDEQIVESQLTASLKSRRSMGLDANVPCNAESDVLLTDLTKQIPLDPAELAVVAPEIRLASPSSRVPKLAASGVKQASPSGPRDASPSSNFTTSSIAGLHLAPSLSAEDPQVVDAVNPDRTLSLSQSSNYDKRLVGHAVSDEDPNTPTTAVIRHTDHSDGGDSAVVKDEVMITKMHARPQDEPPREPLSFVEAPKVHSKDDLTAEIKDPAASYLQTQSIMNTKCTSSRLAGAEAIVEPKSNKASNYEGQKGKHPPRVPSEVICEINCDEESAEKSLRPVIVFDQHRSKIPDEVICGSNKLLDHAPPQLVDEEYDTKIPAIEQIDTMPVDNTTDASFRDSSKPTRKNRPPERIEFDAGEKSSNVSFESHDARTPIGSGMDEFYDRLARQSVGEETMESEVLNSTATIDSSVSGQAELLRRDIEVCSLDIKEALRRVERQKERVRSRQVSSLNNTPTRYSRSLLPPHNRPIDIEPRKRDDVDPAGRFVYLSRIAKKLSSPSSRRSFPDHLILRREQPYTSPVLVEDDDLATLQREARSVQPLVETFEKWTTEHVEKQKNDYSRVKTTDRETDERPKD